MITLTIMINQPFTPMLLHNPRIFERVQGREKRENIIAR